MLFYEQSIQIKYVYTKVVNNSNSTQATQQYLRRNLQVPIENADFFGYVQNFPRVSIFFQFYYRNGAFTGMSDALWKIYQ